MSTMLRTLAAATMLAASHAAAATGDWTQFGFTADGRRNNTHETILNKKTVAQLTSKWGANIPIGTSSPAVANGMVYVGSMDNNLYAFDARIGAPVWQAATGAPIMSSPAVANGVVYIGSNDGRIYAFDAETGAVRWSVHIGSNNSNLVETPVTVAGGLVYAGTTNGHMLALSAKTGILKWTKTAVFSGETLAPAVAHGIVYFANGGGEIDALDARTGASIWMQRPAQGFSGSPAVDGDLAYGNFDSVLEAFDAKTGTERWSTFTPNDSGAIAVGKNHLYAAVKSNLMDVNKANGAVKYNISIPQGVFVAPALANGVLYVGSIWPNNTALAYDAANGRLLWSAATDDKISAAPTVSNGMLYVGSASQFTAYGLP